MTHPNLSVTRGVVWIVVVLSCNIFPSRILGLPFSSSQPGTQTRRRTGPRRRTGSSSRWEGLRPALKGVEVSLCPLRFLVGGEAIECGGGEGSDIQLRQLLLMFGGGGAPHRGGTHRHKQQQNTVQYNVQQLLVALQSYASH